MNPIIRLAAALLQPKVTNEQGYFKTESVLVCVAIPIMVMLFCYFGLMQYFSFAQQDLDIPRETRHAFALFWRWSLGGMFFSGAVEVVVLLALRMIAHGPESPE